MLYPALTFIIGIQASSFIYILRIRKLEEQLTKKDTKLKYLMSTHNVKETKCEMCTDQTCPNNK